MILVILDLAVSVGSDGGSRRLEADTSVGPNFIPWNPHGYYQGFERVLEVTRSGRLPPAPNLPRARD